MQNTAKSLMCKHKTVLHYFNNTLSYNIRCDSKLNLIVNSSYLGVYCLDSHIEFIHQRGHSISQFRLVFPYHRLHIHIYSIQMIVLYILELLLNPLFSKLWVCTVLYVRPNCNKQESLPVGGQSPAHLPGPIWNGTGAGVGVLVWSSNKQV